MSQLATARRPPAAPSPAPELDLRRQLGWVTIAWVFGSAWLWTISGAAMTRFCKDGLGMPDEGFGYLAALPFLGTLFQIPASYWLERNGGRKSFFLVTAATHRALWVVAGLIPWIFPDLQPYWWKIFIGVLMVSWMTGQASGPAWVSWMSDLIPRRIRGRYFAVRRTVTQPIALAVTIGIGFGLDLVQDRQPTWLLPATAALLVVAGVLGTLDILCFRYVDDPTPRQPKRAVSFFRLMREPLRNRHFRKYLAFNFVFTCGIGFMGQYVWLYAFDVIGWSNWQANLLILAVPLVAQMLTFRLWGRLIDRLGKKPVLLITGFFTIWGAVGWLLISPDRFWLGYSLIVLTTLAWPGMEIANFNFTLDLAGSRQEGGHHGKAKAAAGTAYVAVNSLAVAVGGVLSGVLAAQIADGFQPMREPVLDGSVVLTYHGLLFVISTLLRAAALIWAAQLEEPKAAGTRDAIRYMTGSFYSNVRSAILMPSRMVGNAVRSSYKVGR